MIARLSHCLSTTFVTLRYSVTSFTSRLEYLVFPNGSQYDPEVDGSHGQKQALTTHYVQAMSFPAQFRPICSEGDSHVLTA